MYKTNFPKDRVIVCDAHQYLLHNFKEYDFIWASPPCPSHSCIRIGLAVESGQNEPVYPDMKLYEEIIFLKHYFKGHWVVENVISYYDPLIKPYEIGGHYFWSDAPLNKAIIKNGRCHNGTIEELQKRKGFEVEDGYGVDKRKVLRNCVEPEIGLHIFNNIFKVKQERFE